MPFVSWVTRPSTRDELDSSCSARPVTEERHEPAVAVRAPGGCGSFPRSRDARRRETDAAAPERRPPPPPRTEAGPVPPEACPTHCPPQRSRELAAPVTSRRIA